jgi:hypothetical protein
MLFSFVVLTREAVPMAVHVQLRWPLPWLRQHIDSLRYQAESLQEAVRLWEQANNEGRGFRSSALKTLKELQGVPINVHSQARPPPLSFSD